MDTGKANRKRGIIASRVKLENAMLAAGLRTQLELAGRIAAAEHATSIPKDMVSRAFRQVPIDPKSLQRIATVLDVPAYSLYLAGDELQLQHQLTTVETLMRDSEQQQPLGAKSIKGLILLVTVLSLVTMLSSWVALHSETDLQDKPSSVQVVKLLVQTNRQDTRELIAAVQQAVLPEIQFKWREDVDSKTTKRVGASRHDDFTGVLTFNLTQHSRFSVIEVLLLTGAEQIRLSYHVVESALLQPGPISAIADNLAAEILAYTSGFAGYQTLNDVDVQRINQYLEARLLFDLGQFALYQQKISVLLNDTVEHAPYFAPAYAALCQMHRLKSWSEAGSAALAEAAAACDKAFSLAPQDQFVLAMNAKLALAVDAPDVAQTFYEKMLLLWPDNPWALQGLACLNIKRYKRDSRLRMLLTDAVNYLQRAINAEPDFYLHHHTLSLAYYFLADAGASQSARRQAARLINKPDMRLNILANTMCAADNTDSVATASLH